MVGGDEDGGGSRACSPNRKWLLLGGTAPFRFFRMTLMDRHPAQGHVDVTCRSGVVPCLTPDSVGSSPLPGMATSH